MRPKAARDRSATLKSWPVAAVVMRAAPRASRGFGLGSLRRGLGVSPSNSWRNERTRRRTHLSPGRSAVRRRPSLPRPVRGANRPTAISSDVWHWSRIYTDRPSEPQPGWAGEGVGTGGGPEDGAGTGWEGAGSGWSGKRMGQGRDGLRSGGRRSGRRCRPEGAHVAGRGGMCGEPCGDEVGCAEGRTGTRRGVRGGSHGTERGRNGAEREALTGLDPCGRGWSGTGGARRPTRPAGAVRAGPRPGSRAMRAVAGGAGCPGRGNGRTLVRPRRGA